MSSVEYHYRDRRYRENCIDVMNVIEESDHCTRKDLQLRCHMSGKQVLRCLKKLERDGRIKQGTHPEDARKTIYQEVEGQ